MQRESREEGVPAGGQARQREIERQQAERRVSAGEQPWDFETGVRSVVDAVRDLPFPKSLEEIADVAGDRQVHTGKGISLPLAEVLTKLKEEDFETLAAFQTAVQRHWKGIEQLERPPEQRPGGAGRGEGV